MPVLYQQESYTPFIPATDTDVLDIDDFLEPSVSNLVGFPQEGRYGFIGRDYDILRLERAFRQNNIVLLQGMAGVGKTELACGLARWLEETQGRTGKIFFMSFEQGATLSNVVNQVGREVWGDKFSQYRAEQQQQAVLKYLKTQPSLLIWDNFEPVAGFPAGNEPLLNASERDTLQRFLKDLRGGKSWVLITSRRGESWLDCGYRLLDLRGLREQDVEELAAKILETVGVDRKNLPAEYLKLLGFYALLAGTYDRELISNAELASFVLRVEEPNLLQNLRLAEQQQSWKYAHTILRALGQVYERIGRKLEFRALRQRALSQIGIHLSQAKAKEQDALNFWMYLREVDANEAILTAALKGARAISQEILDELTSLNDLSVNDKIAGLYHQLGIVAQEQRRFDEATTCYQKALQIFENAGDLYNAADEYHQLGWVAQEQQRFDEATTCYQKALQIFEDVGDFYKAAGDYLHLGMVAQEQRRFDEAIAFYQKALQIFENAGDLYNAATVYHNLGIVAQQQQQFDKAIAFYQKALQIFEDAGDLYKAARDYHHLGIVAQEQRRFDEATAFYQKALQIFEDAGDLYKAAGVYHQFGIVAQKQRRFEEAIFYFVKALVIYVDKEDFFGAGYAITGLGRMLKQLGESQFDALWREVRGKDCTGDLREAIWAVRDRLDS